MAPAARLERLRKLVQADALPDRVIPPEPAVVVDDDVSGGVSLVDSQLPLAVSSKQLPLELPMRPAPAPTLEDPDPRFVLVKGAASSYNPGAIRTTPAPPKASTKLPVTDLQRGDLAAAHLHFAPIQALAKYPYKFCDKSHSQNIAAAFFDGGKFWGREWDLYYIWDVEPTIALILVSESQFQDLLTEINSHHSLSLKITDYQREESLVTRFPDHPECRPRFLGRSNSREQYDNMVHDVPNNKFRAADEPARGPPDSGTLEQFKQLMEELWDVQKAKSKENRKKKQQQRLGRQKSMQDQFKRAQRYLGLRPSEATRAPNTSGPPQAIDLSLPAPFVCDQSVVFVCVDVESWERAHHKITEIGVATLDTRDLAGVAPGKDGEAWRSKIKARHFRVKENRHLVNREFITGHPDGFDFGESTFVNLKEAATHVAACFRPPFGIHVSNTAEVEITAMLRDIDLDGKRNIVFLGHDTLGDVRYLQRLGYDPLKAKNIIEAMDTAAMFQVWQREMQPPSLGKVLYHFDIIGWKLHNAGNDAMYTVQAMLAICVRDAMMRGSTELEITRNEDKAARLAAAQELAAQNVNDEAEGWNKFEAAGDGGTPVPLRLP